MILYPNENDLVPKPGDYIIFKDEYIKECESQAWYSLKGIHKVETVGSGGFTTKSHASKFYNIEKIITKESNPEYFL